MATGSLRNRLTTQWPEWALWVAAALVALAGQTSLFGPLAPWGFRPDLVLVVVAVCGLRGGPVRGGALGLTVGFLVDLYGGRLIGMGGLAKLAAGAVAGLIGERVFRERSLVRAGVVMAASIVGNLVYLGLALAFGLAWPVLDGLVRVILPGALSDAVAGLVLYPLLARLVQWSVGSGESGRTGAESRI